MLLQSWHRWTTLGKATVSNGVLCLTGPELAAEEWVARLFTEHCNDTV